MFSFFGKKKKAAPRTASRPTGGVTGTGQKRSAFRMPVEFEVSYTLDGRPGKRRARANDLSAGGLRLSTDEDLVRGSRLALEFHLPGDFLSEMTIEKEVFEQTPFGLRPQTVKVQPPDFKVIHMRSSVLMPFFDRMQKKFAYGTKFLGGETEMQEELQRFIHLWQIHYLRQRRPD